MPDQTDNTTAAHDNNTSRAATLNNTHRSHLRNTHHLHSYCNATQLPYPFGLCLHPTEMDHAKIRVTRIFAARPYTVYQQIGVRTVAEIVHTWFSWYTKLETDASAVSSGTSTHALSARGHHELHARVLNHRFTREASRPFIVQMLATCPHNLSKDAIATPST